MKIGNVFLGAIGPHVVVEAGVGRPLEEPLDDGLAVEGRRDVQGGVTVL